ncbi:MAG: hypothetical protein GY816_01645 [Cytophagales bacterium]|nr:hypothetical protein [Cytophagales bacterium]
MTIDFKIVKNQSYPNRVKFWPTEVNNVGSNFLGNEIFSADHPNNFWRLSEQYYSISWTLWTAAFSERIKWPYADNVSSNDDETHRELIKQKIFDNNWSAPTFLSFAHLSCELAFKAIIFHKTNDPDTMSYPMGHDLEILLEQFHDHTKNSFEEQYDNWANKLNLTEILHNSGPRFIEQRYGNFEYNNIGLGTVNLSRFIHEEFDLQDIPAE